LSQNKIHLDFDQLVTREGLDVLYGGKVIDQLRGAIDLGIITVLLNLYYLLEWVRSTSTKRNGLPSPWI